MLFADGADVTSARSDLDPLHLHWALGTGLRVQTPVGPVRVDVGWRVTRRDGAGNPDPGSGYAVFFALGEAF